MQTLLQTDSAEHICKTCIHICLNNFYGWCRELDARMEKAKGLQTMYILEIVCSKIFNFLAITYHIEIGSEAALVHLDYCTYIGWGETKHE